MANELHSAGYTEEASSLLAEVQKRENDLVEPETDAERKLLAGLIKKYGEQEGSKRFLDSISSKDDKSTLGKYYRDAFALEGCDKMQAGPELDACKIRANRLVMKFKKSETGAQKSLGKQVGPMIQGSYDKAIDASESLYTIESAMSMLNSNAGIISGTAAEMRLGFAKLLNTAGLTDNASVAATETYASTLGTLVGKIIKQFGAGTGLSDADREFALKIAAGSISLDEQSMRQILDIQKRYNTAVINKHNIKMDSLPADLNSEAGLGNDWSYKVDMPNFNKAGYSEDENAVINKYIQ